MAITKPEVTFKAQRLKMGGRDILLCVLVFWIVAFVLQVRNGAYTADIGADPDEPAHAVTSLMVRDYLACGLLRGEHPLHFAQRYYDHFPKVAIGHYPPGFYLLAGLWLLPHCSPDALMVLISLLAAVLATTSAVAALRCGLGKGTACITGLWVLVLPVTQNLATLVMSDLLLASLCLGATLVFAAFLDEPTAGRSLAFGSLAAAAILTKASAVALALVPPLSILILRRWRLLVNWRLFLAPLPVLVTALPWMLMTMKITQEGMQSKTVSEYLPEALAFYTSAVGGTFGVVALLAGSLAVMQALVSLSRADENQANACVACLAAFGVALAVLYLVSPTGLSSRYLLPLVPPVLIAAAFFFREGRRFSNHRFAAELCTLAGAVLSLGFVLPVHHKVASGYSQVAASISSHAAGGKVLISSDARGEGGVIAEMAFLIPDRCEPPWTLVRSSKFMASSEWTGRDYRAAFSSRGDFLAALKRDQIRLIVEDRDVPLIYRQRHHDQMLEWGAGFEPVAEFRSERQGLPSAGPLVLLKTPADEP